MMEQLQERVFVSYLPPEIHQPLKTPPNPLNRSSSYCTALSHFRNNYLHYGIKCFIQIKFNTDMHTIMGRKINLKSVQPEKLQIQLSHFKQKSNWDCGISCILMVLPKKKREEFLNNFSQICKSEGFNKSTWTIDLCYLLKKFDVPHIFYTITLGVHEGYRENSFYHTVLNKDECRINARFKDAEKVGLSVRKKSVSILEIIRHLTNGPVIVLTNAKILSCDTCKYNKISNEFRKCIPWPAPYQGHYVVVCGFDVHNKKLFYRNPSFSDHVCVISMEIFDLARKSYGTDEDIIFTYT